MISSPTSYQLHSSNEDLAAIQQRVKAFDWESFPDCEDWKLGPSKSFMKDLCRYWVDTYDWKATEARLNTLPHFRVDIDGLATHYVHLEHSDAPALLLLHGWPGSFMEFIEVAGHLRDKFELVIPSLPGYAFSAPPSSPMGPRAVARHFQRLMERLGHSSFFIQGGDWGSSIGAWMALDNPTSVLGLHLNLVSAHSDLMVAESSEERAYKIEQKRSFRREGAYYQVQATNPQSLAFAMMDSPVGIAAWIIDKIARWADVPLDNTGAPTLESRFSKDAMLDMIMLYLVTKCFASASWLYRGMFSEGSASLPPGSRITVPVGVAAFPDPAFPLPPRSLVAKGYSVIQWTDMPRGGHFAALEEPALLAEDFLTFASKITEQA
ncbi:epoxide hydrolase [Magnetospirillum sp. 15-1]|uniref:epoxide hydrolase family protein n=1 Tax=Magnetospirillum sp. 15-1 TaxID=1979370 RepID=UPI0014820B64|nr:epoxide hydrolase [Magnetospirillum sp. 15-1]